jgi:hypothetical protein
MNSKAEVTVSGGRLVVSFEKQELTSSDGMQLVSRRVKRRERVSGKA